MAAGVDGLLSMAAGVDGLVSMASGIDGVLPRAAGFDGNQSPLMEAADWSLLSKSHVGRSKAYLLIWFVK